MGLDIYRYNVVTNLKFAQEYKGDDYEAYTQRPRFWEVRMIESEDDTGRMKLLFDRYAPFVYTKKYTEYDMDGTFKAFNRNVNDYEFFEYNESEFDCNDWISSYRHTTTGEIFKLHDCDIALHEVQYECLLLAEYGHFRSTHTKEFWTWSKLDDFEELPNGDYGRRDPKAIDFVLDNNTLDQARKYFKSDSPIHTWGMLNADQIVYFSW